MQEGTYQYPRRNASSFPMSHGAHLPSNALLLPRSPLPLPPLAHPILHRERCVGGHVDVNMCLRRRRRLFSWLWALALCVRWRRCRVNAVSRPVACAARVVTNPCGALELLTQLLREVSLLELLLLVMVVVEL